MGRVTNRRHLKRPAAPRTWPIPRKGTVFVTKPIPGPHPMELSMPLVLWLRDYLGYVKTYRECKYVLNQGKVLVDGVPRKDPAFPVGLFDVISFPDLGEHYRVLINEKQKLYLKPIDEKEAQIKVVRIKRKTMVKGGKIQVTGHDGRNFIFDDPHAVHTGDSLVISLPDQKILDILKMEKGCLLFFYYGAKVGTLGILEEIRIEHKPFGHTRFVKYKDYKTGELKETVWEYAIVIGKDKPVISVI